MIRRCLIVTGLLFAAFAGWRIVQACAPEFAVAVFQFSRHPDFPRSRFLDGHLGVMQPTWARSYLVISWRHLTGIGLNAREKQQAADYYKDRDTGWWDKTGTDWVNRWERVRNRVPGVQRPPKRLLTRGEFAWNQASNTFDLNCAEDAYRNAANTLEARIGRFGIRSRAVREWITAQNQVFALCDGDTKIRPTPASADLPALIQDDRRYQIAAALFYAGDLPQARQAFASLSRDSHSSWQLISRYLVVRTLLRMTETTYPDPAPASRALSQEASAILADPKLAPIHTMTLNLMNRHGIRTANPEYFNQLAKLVASREQGNGFREGLWNYTTEFDRLLGDADPNNKFHRENALKADPAPFEADEMSAWIFHFQSRTPASGRYALERWRRTRRVPWLVAALRHANYATASRNGLLDAARSIAPNSPAYETVAWHYYRLLLDAKEKASARDGLDAILNSAKLTPSSTQLFRSLRMTAAPDLTEFVRFALHRPLMITYDLDEAEAGRLWEHDTWGGDFFARFDSKLQRFDTAAAEVINNQLPFQLIREAAFSPGLPAHIQRELLLTALTRALLLNQDVKEIATKLGETDSALASRATAIADADSDAASRFAAAHLILWQPEAKPFVSPGVPRQTRNGRLDDYRENWWCPVTFADPTSSRGVSRYGYYSYDDAKPLVIHPTQTPVFLTAEQRAEASQERKAMTAKGRAMDFLGGIVLAWAKTHPNDPRIPQALHRLIRGSRITCDGERETAINQQAFRLLKTRYRNTTWARKTKVL